MKRFLRDLLRVPSPNGERRLVKNYFTGKMVWTKGVEPNFVKTKKEDFSVEKKPYIDMEQQDDSKRKIISNSIGYEPIRNGRFIVNFDGVQPYFIKNYTYLGTSNNKHISSIGVYLPASPSLALEEKLLSLEGKKIKPIIIDVVDPIGQVLRHIELSNPVVEEVSLFDNFDYSESNLQMAEVVFSHKKKKIINPFE